MIKSKLIFYTIVFILFSIGLSTAKTWKWDSSIGSSSCQNWCSGYNSYNYVPNCGCFCATSKYRKTTNMNSYSQCQSFCVGFSTIKQCRSGFCFCGNR
ncbi:10958_t:CDS:1, partial [Cetraspora pellucida]